MDAHLECELVGVEQLELALVDGQDGANRQVLLRVIAARVILGARGRAAAGTRPAHLLTRGRQSLTTQQSFQQRALDMVLGAYTGKAGRCGNHICRCMGGIMKAFFLLGLARI